MIRPFDWRDLALLHRMREQGVPLDSQQAYTRGINTFQIGLMEVIAPGHQGCILVAPPGKGGGSPAIGQVLHRTGEPLAQLGFIGPAETAEAANCMQLLDALSHDVGRRGAFALIAEVDEASPIFESLRRAGFAIYARQRVWLQEQGPIPSPAPSNQFWQQEQEEHQAAVRVLYANLVPGLVQQVEQAPHLDHADLVHCKEGDLQAYLDVEKGPRGLWIQPYIHPAVDDIQGLLGEALQCFRAGSSQPLYFSVRSYQGWIGHALERLGLQAVADQAVMVKRLAARQPRAVSAPIPAVDGTRAEPTIPFAATRHPSQQQTSPLDGPTEWGPSPPAPNSSDCAASFRLKIVTALWKSHFLWHN